MTHNLELMNDDSFQIVQKASEWSEISTFDISGFQSSLALCKL